MTTSKIKVEDVKFNREWTSPAGNTVYYFDLKDDAENWYVFSTSKKEQTKFLIGKEYQVDIEDKQNVKGSFRQINPTKADQLEKKSSGAVPPKAGYSYVRSRKEVISIITQSSYEAAVTLCVKVGKEVVNTHSQIASVAKQFTAFVIDQSGLNSTECKNGLKDFLKEANERSIVYQKALKLAILCLELPLMEKELVIPVKMQSTEGMIRIAELILNDINIISNGF